MRKRQGMLVALAAICIASGADLSTGDFPSAGRVLDVQDGDTVTVGADGEDFKCRLLGIDSPETSYARLWTEIDKVVKCAPLQGRRELY